MEGSLMMDTQYDLTPAKKVYLYTNGVTNKQPKCMVVNDRQIRDFSTFLSIATSGLRAPVAIRNIYTPAGGHKVNRLDDLETGRYYVAGGSEHFKKVKYGSETKRLLARRQQRESLTLPTRSTASVVVASARYRKPIEKPYVIHVFRNGDERYRGARVLIPRRMMGSWEYVLELVTEKSRLITPAKRLCTLDGQVLHAVSELQDGGKYVALIGTKSFQKVSYSALEEKKSLFKVAVTVPRTMHRLKKRFPPRPRAAKRNQEVETVKLPPIDTKHKNFERRKSRPFGGRKNKEGREKGIEDHRADSVFGGSLDRPTYPLEPRDPVISSRVFTHNVLVTEDNRNSPVSTRKVLATHDNQSSSVSTRKVLATHDNQSSSVSTRKVLATHDNQSSSVSTHEVLVTQGNKESSETTFHQTTKTLDSAVVLPPDTHEVKATSIPAAQETVDAPVEDEVMEDLDTSMPVEEALNQPTMEERSNNPLDEAGDVEEVLEEAGDPGEGDKTITRELTHVVTQNTDEGLHYGKANKQELKELESQPLQNAVDLSLQRNKMQSTFEPAGSTENSSSVQVVTNDQVSSVSLSKRSSSAKSKHTSTRSSATKSRSQSVNKLNPSQTQVLSGLGTGSESSIAKSKHTSRQSSTTKSRSQSVNPSQTQVLSGLGTESGLSIAKSKHTSRQSSATKSRSKSVNKLNPSQTQGLSGPNTGSESASTVTTTTTTYHYYIPAEGGPPVIVDQEEATVVESRVVESMPTEDTNTTLQGDQGGTVEEISSEQILGSDESKPDNHIEAPEVVEEEVVEEDIPVETSRVSPTAEPEETTFVIEDSQTDS